MSDIVDRLLAGTGGGKHWMELQEEAAEEIKRLRQHIADALREIPAAAPGPAMLTGEERWVAVEDRLPKLPDDDDDVPVWTWDGRAVEETHYGLCYEQPAGPAVGGRICTGEDFAGNIRDEVTHWMPRPIPQPPAPFQP